MFDLSWAETLFVVALAIIVVGPRDLPKLARTVGTIVRRGQRVYRDALSSIQRLEQEIDAASQPEGQTKDPRADLLPKEVKEAMRMDAPTRDPQKNRETESAYHHAVAQTQTPEDEASDGAAGRTPEPAGDDRPREEKA